MRHPHTQQRQSWPHYHRCGAALQYGRRSDASLPVAESPHAVRDYWRPHRKGRDYCKCLFREHALSWKLSQSPKVDRVFTAPGNGGTQNNVPIDVDDLDALAEFAQKNNSFTVVGPESPVASGLVDKFNEFDLKVFGPSKNAAQLESSKI